MPVAGPAIFVDRDGVINRRRPGDYVLDWSQFIFVDGIRSVLKRLSSLGLPIIIISNQAAVGKGLLSVQGLERITSQLQTILLADQVPLLAAYYCPHRAEEDCICRKPKPGLLLRAAEDYEIDLARSVFIGDSATDVEAARAAGCKPVLLRGSGDLVSGMAGVPVADSPEEILSAVAQFLEASGESKWHR